MDGSPDVALPLELQSLSNFLEESPETLALGNQDLQAAALNTVKYVFDLSIQSEASSKSHVVELISSLSLSQAPQTRSRTNAELEKNNSQFPDKNIFESTPLKSLYLDGMDEEQIWEQLDLRTKTICRVLDFVLEGESEQGQNGDTESEDEDEDEDEKRLLKALEDLKGDEDIDMDGLVGEESESSSGQSSSQSSSHLGSDLEDDEEEENYLALRDPSSDEDIDGEVELSVFRSSNQSLPRKKRGKNAPVSELDDDFFNLAEFNADMERAEARSSSRGRLAENDESDEDMDIDLFARIDSVENFDEDDLEGNPYALFYNDFFPPSSSAPAKTR